MRTFKTMFLILGLAMFAFSCGDGTQTETSSSSSLCGQYQYYKLNAKGQYLSYGRLFVVPSCSKKESVRKQCESFARTLEINEGFAGYCQYSRGVG